MYNTPLEGMKLPEKKTLFIQGNVACGPADSSRNRLVLTPQRLRSCMSDWRLCHVWPSTANTFANGPKLFSRCCTREIDQFLAFRPQTPVSKMVCQLVTLLNLDHFCWADLSLFSKFVPQEYKCEWSSWLYYSIFSVSLKEITKT